MKASPRQASGGILKRICLPFCRLKNNYKANEKPMTKNTVLKPNLLKRFFSSLGPGLITGAADDDPSGIATYSIAGAQLGTSLLWMSWVTWPLMAAVQMMCARIGMVTGQGLAGALSNKIPKSLLVIFCFALWIANTINIAVIC